MADKNIVMSEDSEGLNTASSEQTDDDADHPSAQETDNEQLVQQIADALDEPVVKLIRKTVSILGAERAETLFHKTQEIESSGGMMTADGQRRRTPGGVFFRLVRDATTPAEQKQIFRRPPRPGAPTGPQQRRPKPLTWPEARKFVIEALENEPSEPTSVKVTLIGRPTQVSKAKSCVVVTLKGSRPPSLPKGLPPAPDGSDFSYAVFISNKHWNKVAPVMAKDGEDRLVIEGYPLFDPKRGVAVIFAQNVRTLGIQRARRSRR